MKIELDKIEFSFINSKNRTDRLQHVQSEFIKYGINAKKFEAITNPDDYDIKFFTENNEDQKHQWTNGQKGCYISHRLLLENHKSENILGIFEDDVVFCEDFIERMEYIKNNFDYEWDIFFLSSFYHLNNDTKRWNNTGDYELTETKYIHRTYGSFTTHSYLVNPKSIKKILSKMDDNFKDCYAIDHLYILIQPHLNVYSFTPGMTNQIKSYSDVLNDMKDQTMFEQICGKHYFINKLENFDYDDYFKKNK